MIKASKAKFFFSFTYAVAIAVFLLSCNSTKYLKPGEYLLNKNIIKVEPKTLKTDLVHIIKQKPNRKILGLFRFHLVVYNMGASGKVDSAGNYKKFNRWLMNTVGEEPTLIDTFLTAKSSKQLKQYMQNIGYFNATVIDSTVFKKNHEANVYYFIKSFDPYKVKSYEFNIYDKYILRLIENDSAQCAIKPGNIYSQGDIQKERDRITKMLRNSGYFFFSQQYIHFSVDSSLNTNLVNIKINIDNPDFESTDTTESALFHQRYSINNVYVIPDYDLLAKDDYYLNRDTLNKNDVYFILQRIKKQQFKNQILEQHIFISKNNLIKQKDIDLTYKRLQDLGVFRFVNVRMEKPLFNDTSANLSNKLDCIINLTPGKMQDYSIENELTTSGGNIGIAGSISYRNKNFFHGTELFEVKVRGSVESQPDFTSSTNPENQHGINFNTYDGGLETHLSFHQFLLPFKTSQNEKTYEPITKLTAAINLENRVEYNRSVSNLSLTYSFKKNPKVRHFITPAELNFVNVNLTDAYAAQIDSLNDESIKYSYSDHFIASGRYSMIYNNQYLGRIKNVIYFRFNSELAGNTLYLWDIARQSKLQDSITGNYQRRGVDYAQYLRPDIDLRYYQVFSPNTQLVYRFIGGAAMPYGNSQYILFEKSFYCGGSSDIRAFHPYTLGPGGYKPTTTVQQFGQLKMEFNAEYRFKILKILEGAFFYDAGNVWMFKEDSLRPLADFKINRFYKEIAMGGGIGFRLNFTFFVFRLDAAVPIKDPGLPEGERFVIKSTTYNNFFSRINWNLGIGYPF